ncbi:CsgE family curli-type amyloid fiber assembly protein [Methylobacter sp. sgz302048]|uniref:CsgE family curli-type amyloid fiber assembly protein n=1 Tax=Methylobacter sp. sgz302048 TaxID=3455945 RepID=UPI003F9F7E38
MKRYIFAILLLPPSLAVAVEPQFEVGGLVVDQTMSRIGHLFYEELINGWEVPDDIGTITVYERPDIFAGNIIWVEINDNIVFQDRVGTRPNGIEEKALAARALLELYIQQRKDALRGLEIY